MCGDSYVTNVATQDEGKLVWKVDWPMRWTFEGVDFEPAGVDHASPGSSYTVGKELIGPIFGGTAPSFVGYSFVGVAGMPKMSSSKGGVPTAAEALRILEAPILRWLYVRRQPKQAFNVDFGQEVLRLYDEWDALTRKAADPAKRDAAVLAWERASATAAAGTLPAPAVVVPFRMLSSVADVTAGSLDLISQTVGKVGYAHASVADLEPRLSKAATWMTEYVDPEDRTDRPRPSADADRLRRARRGRGALAPPAARPPPRLLRRRRRADRPDLRRPEALPRPGARRPADRRGQGRPEGVLPAPLRAPRRRRARPAPAHPLRRARAGPGAGPADAAGVSRVGSLAGVAPAVTQGSVRYPRLSVR